MVAYRDQRLPVAAVRLSEAELRHALEELAEIVEILCSCGAQTHAMAYGTRSEPRR